MINLLEHLAALNSPYPLVNIDAPAPPADGLSYATPKICQKVFRRGECEQFYRSLREAGGRHQCPYGFSVWPIKIGTSRQAVTGLIGAPRQGGDKERLRAKEYPDNKIAADTVPSWAAAIAELVADGEKERAKEFVRKLEALHEIRRFNQIIKTNMERSCRRASPNDPDDAPEELVRANRASELISVQLDALDLLANPESAMTFTPSRWVLYRVVDKMVRMYRILAENRKVNISLSGSSNSEALLDNRTIHIIPSVFIDNAVKYSEPGETVEVNVSDEVLGDHPIITVTVRSKGPASTEEEKHKLFVSRGRGKLARRVAQGGGIGLTLAKIVADQHKGWISSIQNRLDDRRSEWIFGFRVPTA